MGFRRFYNCRRCNGKRKDPVGSGNCIWCGGRGYLKNRIWGMSERIANGWDLAQAAKEARKKKKAEAPK